MQICAWEREVRGEDDAGRRGPAFRLGLMVLLRGLRPGSDHRPGEKPAAAPAHRAGAAAWWHWHFLWASE